MFSVLHRKNSVLINMSRFYLGDVALNFKVDNSEASHRIIISDFKILKPVLPFKMTILTLPCTSGAHRPLRMSWSKASSINRNYIYGKKLTV